MLFWEGMIPSEFNNKLKHRMHEWLPVFLILALTAFVFLFDFPAADSIPEQVSDAQIELPMVAFEPEEVAPEVPRVELPDEVRGLYWTSVTAASQRGQDLLAYMKQTGINAVVIDTKMDNGEVSFTPHDESILPYVQRKPGMDNIDEILAQLHEEGIYRIARIPVMRDAAFAHNHPHLAMQRPGGGFWYDDIGSLWVDPAGSEVSDYAIALAKEAYARGFDEIQFDYVRFASDGAVSSIVYPVYNKQETKVAVMQRFFKKVGSAMQEAGIPVSFDLFGMTYFSHNDFNIGQRMVDVFPYSDFTSAMVYPSHYPNGFRGLGNPAEHPYAIVKMSMDEGADRMRGLYSGSEEELRKTFRPWIQDFDIGAVYTAPLIEAQIQAARDTGCSGWILWNARNVYEPANYLPSEAT